jgi:hypothetical protein
MNEPPSSGGPATNTGRYRSRDCRFHEQAGTAAIARCPHAGDGVGAWLRTMLLVAGAMAAALRLETPERWCDSLNFALVVPLSRR